VRPSTWRFRIGAGALLTLTLACRAPSEVFEATWDRPGSNFSPEARAAFSLAMARLAADNAEGARSALSELVAADPENVEAGVWLQDVELLLLARSRRGLVPADEGLARLARDPDAEGALRRRYQRRAEDAPSVAAYVLAARLAPDARTALALLDGALALDPNSAWTHYARAHAWLLDDRLADRWSLAREALDAALRRDPGFLRARRLRAWMLAEEGQHEGARAALQAWLRASEGDPRVAAETRVEAQLDLALLWLLTGRPERARQALEALEGTPTGRARRLALLAVAEQEDGELQRSLEAVRRAELADRGSVLPRVQHALLAERFAGDPEAAEALWRKVAEHEGDATELGALVQGLRARVKVERAEAQRLRGGEGR